MPSAPRPGKKGIYLELEEDLLTRLSDHLEAMRPRVGKKDFIVYAIEEAMKTTRPAAAEEVSSSNRENLKPAPAEEVSRFPERTLKPRKPADAPPVEEPAPAKKPRKKGRE